MKIAFLNIYNGKVERGAEVFVSSIGKVLSASHQVDIFQTKRLPFVSHTKLSYHFLVFIFSLAVIPKLFLGKYDWIIPVNGGLQVLLIRIIRFLTKAKILISGHAGVGRDDWWNIVVGCPDIFVALTPRALIWATTLRHDKKIIYIPNGIDTHQFSPDGKHMIFQVPKPIVLCVSALLPYKRIDLLIRAMSYVSGASLVVVGDGPLRGQLKKMGQEVLGSRFQLILKIPHIRMPEVYRGVTIFSLPSQSSEAFGLVYLEAMACNIPVVAPNDESRREIIGDAGFYIDPQNSEEYARVIEKTIQTSFGTRPRNQAEKFLWGIVSRRYEEAMQNG